MVSQVNLFKPAQLNELNVAIIGLGYVGLPLAVEFSKHFKTIGFDINSKRVQELGLSIDKTLEVTSNELKQSKVIFSHKMSDIKTANVYIITVPTPIDEHKKPDLSALISASQSVSLCLKKGDFVIYESTVYPGATEEVCVPNLEKSELKFNQDFFVGYSPERINPGDKEHRLADIPKVVSASNSSYADLIKEIYQKVIKADIYLAESIKVAEAAKVIENTQRDLNIALINELSQIFNLLKIDTEAVLKAAATKWNFHHYKPGLVGGHCIGVDPYYLTYKAKSIGFDPKVILAGREINDNMSHYVANQFVDSIDKKNPEGIHQSKRILICGLTFKENCPDIRNSKIFDLIDDLVQRKIEVEVFDPWLSRADFIQLEKKYQFSLITKPSNHKYDGVLIAVSHSHFKNLGASYFKKLVKSKGLIYDFKQLFLASETEQRL